jgi:hypothetical protein
MHNNNNNNSSSRGRVVVQARKTPSSSSSASAAAFVTTIGVGPQEQRRQQQSGGGGPRAWHGARRGSVAFPATRWGQPRSRLHDDRRVQVSLEGLFRSRSPSRLIAWSIV